MLIKVRKKPVVVEAVQLTHENISDIMKMTCGTYWSRPPMRAVSGVIIPTLEGGIHASFGDWIIKGIAGEFYPCKPDIFEKIYVVVDT